MSEGLTDVDLFAGRGEMRTRCREVDWGSTPLGPVSSWSQGLRTIVAVLLASRQPMFLFWGPELVQIYNDAYRPSLGRGGRAETALGAKGKEFWTEIWDTIGPQIELVMSGGDATWFEDQLLPIERNGHIEDVYWTYSYSGVRDDDGTVGGTLVVCQETTGRVVAERDLERARAEAVASSQHLEDALRQSEAARAALEESEARFRTVQDASPDASLLMRAIRGEDGRTTDFEITYANHAVNTILLGRDEQLLGRTMREAFPESVSAGRLDRYAEIVETGERWLEDVNYTRGPVAHGLRVSAVKVGDGVHLSAADLTERIQAAEERERLLEETEVARLAAEKANRAKSEFLAVMSHELRTPLNAIAGYCELLELGIHGPVTAEQRNALTRIQASQRHLLGLITSVLNYARVEGGVLTYVVEDVSIPATINTCEALTAPQMRSKGLNFRTTWAEASLAARGDSEKVQQILLNLLGNAIKFTSNEGRIDLHAFADSEHVVVTVSDSGVGIAPDNLTRVFEPFVQVDSRFTRPHEGVGLGLAISRDLARGMGGDLSVQSEVGVGSTFTLTLPRA